MKQRTHRQENILLLLKKIADSAATDEEKVAALKKLGASVEEFNYLVGELKKAVQEEKRGI